MGFAHFIAQVGTPFRAPLTLALSGFYGFLFYSEHIPTIWNPDNPGGGWLPPMEAKARRVDAWRALRFSGAAAIFCFDIRVSIHSWR